MRAFWALPLLCLLLLPAAATGGTGPDGKPLADDLGATLPLKGGGYAAVWLDGAVYAFGGTAFELGSGGTDQVLRIDPVTGKAAVLEARAPARMYHATVATDGKHAYIFSTQANKPTDDGTSTTGDNTQGIYRFDPADGSFATMDARLPDTIHHGSAVWDGERFRILGGCTGEVAACVVLSYDPIADTLSSQPVLATEDVRFAFTNGKAIMVDGAMHVFPSYSMTRSATAFRYDPATGEAVALPTPMAEPRQGYGAVAYGSRVLFIGGGTPEEDGGVPWDTRVLEYDVARGSSGFTCIALPDRAGDPAAVQTPFGILVVGASTLDGDRHVYRIDPAWADACDAKPEGKPVPEAPRPAADPPVDAAVARDALSGSVAAGAKAEMTAADALVRHECGDRLCRLDVALHATADPALLPVPLPPLADATLYIEVEDRSPVPAASVLIELPVEDPAGRDWAVHYHNGAEWVDLAMAGGFVEGATDAQDLEVYATGYDKARGVAWARVEHASAYAVAPSQAAATQGEPASTPWHQQPVVLWSAGAVVALVLVVELVAVAVVARRRA